MIEIFLTHTAVHVLFVQAERECVSKHLEEQDLLLDTARRNIQAELQGTISEKLTLQKQLWDTHTNSLLEIVHSCDLQQEKDKRFLWLLLLMPNAQSKQTLLYFDTKKFHL